MKKSFLTLSMVASLLLVGCSDSSSSDNVNTTTTSSSSEGSSSSEASTNNTQSLKLSAKEGFSYLVDSEGMALYTFDNDAVATSNCVDACEVTWPVYGAQIDLSNLPAGIEASMLDTITREDGSTQVTYNDQPLYYFVNDLAAGDINGEGVKDIWHLVKFETSNTQPLKLASKDDFNYLVDSEGMALYTFDNDTAAKSNCVDACEVTWPVYGDQIDLLNLPAGVESSTLDTITREDGSTQVTYNDQPLYYFVNDLAAGDINGEGVKDIWHLVKFNTSPALAASIVLGNNGASDYIVSSIDNENIAGLDQSDPTFNFTVGKRYAISVTNFQAHPLNLNASNGVVLLAMGSNEGSFESDTAVDFSDDGAGTITFTLTQALADVLEVYRCEFHASMTGSILAN